MPNFTDYINSQGFVLIEDNLDYFTITMKAQVNNITGDYLHLDGTKLTTPIYTINFYKTNLHPKY